MREPSPNWRSAWITLFGTTPPEDLGTVDPADLKLAFRRRARDTHPDLAGSEGDDAGRAFREVTDAYELLLRSTSETPRRGPRRYAPGSPGPVQVAPSPPPRRGRVPNRRLALAQFLVHLGWVSSSVALDALRWQQASRYPLGQLAVDLGRLGTTDIPRVLRHQHHGERFGACAVRLGLLSPEAVRRLLDRQRGLLPPIGQFFVKRDLLTPQRLRDALARQRAHNAEVLKMARGVREDATGAQGKVHTCRL